jgi:hypothetical protein
MQCCRGTMARAQMALGASRRRLACGQRHRQPRAAGATSRLAPACASPLPALPQGQTPSI